MAAPKNFRSSLHGFNRQDVVEYIEYLNNQHNAKIAQLNTQLQYAKVAPTDGELRAQLEAANARIAELEAQLAGQATDCSQQELEAYRRAEAAERQANIRAGQIYAQANAVLAEATVKADAAAQQLATISKQAIAQLQVTKEEFLQAVAALGAIAPTEE